MPSRVRRLCVVFAVVGAACLIVAFLERHVTTANTSGIGIAGAYFNRSVGGSNATFSVCAGAGAALLVAAAACALVLGRVTPAPGGGSAT